MKITFSLLDDPQLIAYLKNGNRAALDEIYQRNSDFLFRYAYKRLADPEDAPDLIQDLFLKLWTKKEEVIIEGSLRGYLTQCLKNLLIDQFRHSKVKNEFVQYTNQKRDYSNITEDQLNYLDFKNNLQFSISHLPSKMQEIFILRKLQELSIKEIALKLNISTQTVKNQVGTAVLRLKASLKY